MTQALFLTLFLSSSLYGEDIFDLAARYNQTKKDVTKLESEKRDILAEIYSIEKETNKMVLQTNELSEEKLALDAKLREISKEVVSLESKISALIPELTERLNMANTVNELPWFYSFLTSQSLSDLNIAMLTAEHLNQEQSAQVINFMNLVSQLEENQAELKATAVEIVGLQKDLQLKEKEIKQNQIKQKNYLKNLERRLSKERTQLKRIKGQGYKALKDSFFEDLTLLFGSNFFDKKGQLPHPSQQAVSLSFGLNQGLLPDGIQLVHKGNFYASSLPDPVFAVSDGRVRYVGSVQGMGQVVIVDHGSRYYTVYANLDQVEVKAGQELKSKAILGSTGHRHLQLGLGLYFEIRHFSQPQDPGLWLAPQNQQKIALQSKGHL
jgi:septal ring factor EnvC (AmiA/AmiB activator)